MRLIGFALVALLLALPGGARAHAFLDHASPKVGSTVTTAPKEVVLWFTEKLEPKFSSIEVRNENGVAMQIGKARGGPQGRAQLQVAVKSLPPGKYIVIWHALSVDTHHTQGSFTFTVAH
jgi:copper resistance protein C